MTDPYVPRLLDYLQIGVRDVVAILGKGSVNWVSRVEKEDGGTVILRLNHDRHAEEALYEYSRESWCLKKAREAGILSPEPLGYGRWEDRSWMLQTYVPGPTADEVPEANESTWRFLGDCLRKLERAEFSEDDSEARQTFGPEGPRYHWQGQLALNIESLTPRDPLLALGVYPLEGQNEIRASFALLKGIPLRFGLAHGDFSRRNVILGPHGPVLLDWGCATEHIVPLYDIVETMRNGVDGDPDEAGLRAFSEGYGGFADRLSEIRSLRLLRAFDLVRWAIDRKPERIPELAESARTTFQSWKR
ncbi:aminoglycoside phosphotransferase family protein [bacterium]|nr:MAG: aminoglycoside phosphotransferase family protein [bacterium]